ncbi:response regulator [Haloferula sp. A504]|uniref:response regulator n=1 Tax=Haloferula sp. A504 TaxID=3373601 RepID=UPI0031C81C9C|nr:response regulator transcription factor [Verrucomicrobiaceae bacterium E54]
MNPASSTRVLIVDDHAMVRLALAGAIEQQDDMELVGEAENGARAVELYRELRPDVATMDYKLPDHEGDEVIAKIIGEFPDARILLLSIFETEESLYRATEAGALGCVSKAAEIDEMIDGIRAVARGEPFFSDGLEGKLADRRARDGLSPRELDVLRQLISGSSNKEIADALNMAPSTVKHHLERVFAKLDAKDRTHAATIAMQRGIVRIDDR